MVLGAHKIKAVFQNRFHYLIELTILPMHYTLKQELGTSLTMNCTGININLVLYL